MTQSTTTCVGVDGGGSHCRFALLHDGRRYEVKLGSANMTTDLGAALQVIDAGIDALAHEANIARAIVEMAPAHLGMAGVADPMRAQEIARALPFYSCALTDDRPTALKGAFGDDDGFVAALGTGSFFAGQIGGDMRFGGGWGLVLGDEASGGWLGKAALRRMMGVFDHPHTHTDMIDTLKQLVGPSRSDVVQFAISKAPHEFAALAPIVMDAADAGDDHAIDIVEVGAEHIRKGLVRIGWDRHVPVALTGGLGVRYAPYLCQEIKDVLVHPNGTALDGALHFAQILARSK